MKENNNSLYGIFWIPPLTVIDFVQSWKQRVRVLEPSARYLDHPTHCTFFLFMGKSAEEPEMKRALTNLCGHQRSFLLECNSWHVFENDTVAGGNTLAISIAISKYIFELQKKIAESFLIFKREAVPYSVEWNGPFLQSYQKWGFPFVGQHWLPHLSIASVKGDGRKIIPQAIDSLTLPKTQSIRNLSLYRINGEIHTHLETTQFI